MNMFIDFPLLNLFKFNFNDYWQISMNSNSSSNYLSYVDNVELCRRLMLDYKEATWNQADWVKFFSITFMSKSSTVF